MSKFKAGATISPAEAWKERAEELAQEVLAVTQDRDILQDRLNEIAEIAAPDRVEDTERLDRIEGMLQMLIQHAGLGIEVVPEENTE